MRVYIAGPMSGYPSHNYDQFNLAAECLRRVGYEVENPAENDDGSQDKPRQFYVKLDIERILRSDAVALLPGWQNSTGAKLEVRMAQELGLPLYDAWQLTNKDEVLYDSETSNVKPIQHVTEEATNLVYGNRGQDYGHPYKDFSRTAAIWTGLFGHKLRDGESFSAPDVGLAMIGVKMSREINHPKRDNRVDMCGYAETLQMLADYEESHS